MYVHASAFLKAALSYLTDPRRLKVLPWLGFSLCGWEEEVVGEGQAPQGWNNSKRKLKRIFLLNKDWEGWLLSLILPSLHVTMKKQADFCEFRFFIWRASVAVYLCVTGKLNWMFVNVLIESQIVFPLSVPLETEKRFFLVCLFASK